MHQALSFLKSVAWNGVIALLWALVFAIGLNILMAFVMIPVNIILGSSIAGVITGVTDVLLSYWLIYTATFVSFMLDDYKLVSIKHRLPFTQSAGRLSVQ